MARFCDRMNSLCIPLFIVLYCYWKACQHWSHNRDGQENQCCTLPEYRVAFKSLRVQRHGEYKRFVGKQRECPYDPGVFWELSTDIHADYRKKETKALCNVHASDTYWCMVLRLWSQWCLTNTLLVIFRVQTQRYLMLFSWGRFVIQSNCARHKPASKAVLKVLWLKVGWLGHLYPTVHEVWVLI